VVVSDNTAKNVTIIEIPRGSLPSQEEENLTQGGAEAPDVTDVVVSDNTAKNVTITEIPRGSLPSQEEEKDKPKINPPGDMPKTGPIPSPKDAGASPKAEDKLVLVPADPRVPENKNVRTLPPEAEIAPIPPRHPVIPAVHPPEKPDAGEQKPDAGTQKPDAGTQKPDRKFSVPLITMLERGRYYLQVAAYTKAEHVERELSKIGNIYPLAVQDVGDERNPLYRILVGPVNLGESGALLQQFKGLGYKDAFVRHTP
jgi:cell division septation protein DedD